MDEGLGDGFSRLTVEGVDVVPPESLGPVAVLQWLPLDLLVVDTSYQRDSGGRNARRRIASIAAKFDWRKFTPVVVSPIAGGFYAIVDGQHRATAAMACGVKTVPCSIVMADAKVQAEAFEAINNQVTNVTPQQIFKAKVAAGDPQARRVRRVADDAGVVIMTSHKSASEARPEETMALGAITRSISFHGEARTTLALKLLREASTGGRRALVAASVTALVGALAERPDIEDDPDLARRSASVDYGRLRSEGMRLAAIDPTRRPGDHLRDLVIQALDPRPPARIAA